MQDEIEDCTHLPMCLCQLIEQYARKCHRFWTAADLAERLLELSQQHPDLMVMTNLYSGDMTAFYPIRLDCTRVRYHSVSKDGLLEDEVQPPNGFPVVCLYASPFPDYQNQ